MHEDTAAQYGLKSGDRVRIISGNGVPAEGLLLADKSVVKGAVCVAHGFGHWAYGATETEITVKSSAFSRKSLEASPLTASFRMIPPAKERYTCSTITGLEQHAVPVFQ